MAVGRLDGRETWSKKVLEVRWRVVVMSSMLTEFVQTSASNPAKGDRDWVCPIGMPVLKKGSKIHFLYRSYDMTRAGAEHRARRWCALR